MSMSKCSKPKLFFTALKDHGIKDSTRVEQGLLTQIYLKQIKGFA